MRLPWPESAAKKLAASTIPDGEQWPSFKAPDKIPDKKFTSRVRVRHDDLDILFHTGMSLYAVFALECGTQAAESDFYSRIRGDLAFYPQRSVRSLFMRESRAGDDLDVSTWEDEGDPMILHFVITKDGENGYYAEIEFYDKLTF
jgi:acyl-CoA thioesterase FadM